MPIVKFVAPNGYFYPIEIDSYTDDSYYLKFSYTSYMALQDEVKNLEGARWLPEKKVWTIKKSERNKFALEYLCGKFPFKKWLDPLQHYDVTRQECMTHQRHMVDVILSRRQIIISGEMGVGKTLAAIEAIELSGCEDILWAAPNSALYAVQAELLKWGANFWPEFTTYDSLKKLVGQWTKGKKPPQIFINDEAHRLKNPTTQRYQAAKYIIENMYKEWDDPYIVLMSGTCVPNDPCMPRDTWILTTDGPKQIWQLENTPSRIIVNSKSYKCSGFHKTGKKLIYEVSTMEGYKFKATANHKILSEYNGIQYWEEVDKLEIGDILLLNQHKDVNWDGYHTYEEGYIVGQVIGDGYISKDSKSHKLCGAVIITGYNDYELVPFIKNILKKEPCYEIQNEIPRFIFRGENLDNILSNFDLDREKEINYLIESQSKPFLIGFLQGLFDSDGNVWGRMVRLSQSDLPRLEAVQRILLYFGIKSTIYKCTRKKKSKFKNIEYETKQQYQLTLCGENMDLFINEIGFRLSYKKDSYRKSKYKRTSIRGFIATIKEIKEIGEEDVYDATVEGIHAFSANGFIAHNCEWWSLTELIRPGWLKEPNPQKLKRRLAIIKDKESAVGGFFPQLISWLDDERKCKICGMYKDDLTHTLDSDHDWQPSTNEVAKLYNRLKGIVDITFKKDVLKELPEKNHRIIRCQPSEEILRAAKLIVANARNAVTAAVLLRELSDGFQYKDRVIGEKECDICKGRKIVLAPKSLSFENCPICDGEIQDNICIGCSTHFDVEEGKEEIDCYNCGGEGIVATYEREAVQVPCPKEDVLKNVLDEYEDTRRAVIYAGFTGSVDRCVDVCKSVDWEIIRVDGRGWVSSIPSLTSPAKMLRAFQEKNTAKLAFVAQSESGGLGITLTASCFEFFYSNSFNAASKSQAMDRIHRPGMNINKGATIIECFHLPSDEKCYEALKKKKRLQDLTLGVFQEALK